MKKAITFLLTLTLALTLVLLLPQAAQASAPPIVSICEKNFTVDTSPLYLFVAADGSAVTSVNETDIWNVKLEGSTTNGVLTLKGLNVSGNYFDSFYGAALYANIPLTIKLIGDNTIQNTAAAGDIAAIRCTRDLTIEDDETQAGVGTLTATCTNSNTNDTLTRSAGIDCGGKLTINSGTVTATGANMSAATAGTAYVSSGIRANRLDINRGAMVEATGGDIANGSPTTESNGVEAAYYIDLNGSYENNRTPINGFLRARGGKGGGGKGNSNGVKGIPRLNGGVLLATADETPNSKSKTVDRIDDTGGGEFAGIYSDNEDGSNLKQWPGIDIPDVYLLVGYEAAIVSQTVSGTTTELTFPSFKPAWDYAKGSYHHHGGNSRHGEAAG